VVVLCEFAFNGDGAVEIGSGNSSIKITNQFVFIKS
jgi:hypothetical protein